MNSPQPKQLWKRLARTMSLAAGAGLAFSLAAPAGASSAPALHVTSGPYKDSQRINISVGANHLFVKYSHVNILECADPGGKKKNLPTSVSSCDGNSIQGNTVLVAKNGSFSEHGYQVYELPSVKALGELAGGRPICSATRACVLYVGENQEKFTAPKEFSEPFYFRKSSHH